MNAAATTLAVCFCCALLTFALLSPWRGPVVLAPHYRMEPPQIACPPTERRRRPTSHLWRLVHTRGGAHAGFCAFYKLRHAHNEWAVGLADRPQPVPAAALREPLALLRALRRHLPHLQLAP